MKEFRARLKARYDELHARYARYWPATFFIAGFVFDIITLSRIDDPLTITQQAVYLFVLALALIAETKDTQGRLNLGPRARRLWAYRDEVVHFLYGSLLSVFILFYFKSASVISSFLFLATMAGLMIANESERFQKLGVVMRFALFSLCLVSYLGYVVPILCGFIGLVPFLSAVLLTIAAMVLLHRLLGHSLTSRELIPERVWKRLGLPAPQIPPGQIGVLAPRASFSVPLIFLLLYLVDLVPPVPLSAQALGIYHRVEKREGRYVLSYERPSWKFWQRGAQTFIARPGDRVYVFTRIFSPGSFRDRINVRWFYQDPEQGWTNRDSIALEISGGREAGYRGFAMKQNFESGDWRVQLETSDGREIARIGFEVIKAGPAADGAGRFKTVID